MFVINPTPVEAILKKARVAEDLAVVALVVAMAYRLDKDALVALEEAPEPLPTDPPDTSIYSVWSGTSVTAAGGVLGLAKAPFVQPASLQVGAVVQRVAVFGDRVWERSLGQLAPSEPRSFDAIPLGFERAFGGGWDIPPGLVPNTSVPHPGGRYVHAMNPIGKGCYPDVERAAGAPLPNIERPEALIKKWNDTPDPAGFTPCRELISFRMRDETMAQFREHTAKGGSPTDMKAQPPPLRLLHHAPPGLIFDDLPPGTSIELVGVGKATMRFQIPESPVLTFARGRSGETDVPARVRAVHADADQRIVRVVFDHSFRYDPRRPPRRVRVARAAEASV